MSNARYEDREYISKSRIKMWVKCARMFYYKYVEEFDTPETEALRKGTDIHEIIEDYYHNISEYVEQNGEAPRTLFAMLPRDAHDNWQEYLDPYLSHFLAFERRRLESVETPEQWVATAVEDEMWRSLFDEDMPELMGHADVLLPAESLPDGVCDKQDGQVLIDFKTGEPGSERYRGHEHAGVMLDLGYYRLLFESKYDIVAVSGYYPKTDTVVVSDIKQERERFIEKVARKITNADPDEKSDYPMNMTPLCKWGTGDDEQCPFLEQCDSTWAVPINQESETVELIKNGHSDAEVATELGTTEDAVNYWVREMRWYRFRD